MLTYHHISLKLLFAYKCNLVGAATFWVRYLFPSLHLFSGTFFRHLLGRISLAVLQIATAFLNFRELWRPLPCGRIPSQPWSMFWYRVCAIRTYHKNKQQYWWNSNHILIIKPFKKQWIKEAVVRNIPSCKTSWRKNVKEKRKNFIVPNLQYHQFRQDGCKNRTRFAGKINWLLTCSEISRKFRLLRKSATILNDGK